MPGSGEPPTLRLRQFTHESGGVVVFDGLGISERLEDGVGLQKLLFQLSLQNGSVQGQGPGWGNGARSHDIKTGSQWFQLKCCKYLGNANERKPK